MTSTSAAPGNVEATTAALQAELPQLEEQQQSLEKELATVTERLESVRAALGALQALSLTRHIQPAALPDTAAVKPVATTAQKAAAKKKSSPVAGRAAAAVATKTPTAEAPVEEASAPVPAKSRKATAGTNEKQKADDSKEQKRRPAKKTAPAGDTETRSAKKSVSAPVDQQSSGLTEQIVEILTKSGSTPVRARDVAQALGRDDTPGSINAVRSTLDRLVATSRAHRAGRGLYQAPTS
ncbi:hypothetical protein ABZ707_32545 [Streptomyces sp. NPDC006923]|uniref:hypothetical protein n=1 Tax=Streptomyces sp. NPDC006923 TaxID=3155355 RepID=UPI0033CF5623